MAIDFPDRRLDMRRHSTRVILITGFTLILGFGLGGAGKATRGRKPLRARRSRAAELDLALKLLSPAAVNVGLYFEIGYGVENLEEAMAKFTSGFGSSGNSRSPTPF